MDNEENKTEEEKNFLKVLAPCKGIVNGNECDVYVEVDIEHTKVYTKADFRKAVRHGEVNLQELSAIIDVERPSLEAVRVVDEVQPKVETVINL